MLVVSPSKLNVNSLQTGLNSNYSPFISGGFVSLKDSDELIQVKIIWTQEHQSRLYWSLLHHFPQNSGRSLLVQGIDLTTFEVPLHRVMLYSE